VTKYLRSRSGLRWWPARLGLLGGPEAGDDRRRLLGLEHPAANRHRRRRLPGGVDRLRADRHHDGRHFV